MGGAAGAAGARRERAEQIHLGEELDEVARPQVWQRAPQPVAGRHMGRVRRARLQLYSLSRPNSMKVSIMLEEIGLPYEAHLVDLRQGRAEHAGVPLAQSERKDPGHRSRRPGREAAALTGVGRDPRLSAGKTGKMIPLDPARMIETMQWAHFQASGVGPMFGPVSVLQV